MPIQTCRPAGPVGPDRRRRTISGTRSRWGYAFTTPFMIVFVGTLVVPLCYAFVLSLYSKTLVAGNLFTGFANYVRAFTDPTFLRGLATVGRFTIVMVPIQLILGVVAALILDELRNRFAAVARVLIFLPYAVPAVVGALMWSFLYSPDMGPLSSIAEFLGIGRVDFLSSSHVFQSLVNIVTWQWSGYYMVIVYSALQGVDQSVYEAATMDGANSLQMALRIKLPLIASSTVMIVLFAVIGTLQFFTEPTVLRNAAMSVIPVDYTPNMYANVLGFSYNQFNYASTIAFSLGAVVAVISFGFLALSRRRSRRAAR